jgi:hypothetical protein
MRRFRRFIWQWWRPVFTPVDAALFHLTVAIYEGHDTDEVKARLHDVVEAWQEHR